MKFIYGPEKYLISKEVKRIKSEIGLEPIVYNENSSLENIIAEINTISLFDSKKLIILKNIIAFNNDEEASFLIKELMNLDQENVIIIFIYEGSPLKTNKLTKFLFKNSDKKECVKINDRNIHRTIVDIVKSKGGTISASAAITLANKIPNDLRLIIQEIEKLLIETSNIEKENIEISIGDYQNDNAFALSNSLTDNDNRELIKAYKEKINNDEDAINIISQIASTFNLAYKVMIYQKEGYSSEQISKELGVHIFRIQKSLNIVNTKSEARIKDIIYKLSDLDKNIKMGKIDIKIGLDNLILNLIK